MAGVGHCPGCVFDALSIFIEEGLCRFFAVGADGIGLVFIGVRDKIYGAVCIAELIIQFCLEFKELFLDLAGLFLITFGGKERAVKGLIPSGVLLDGGGRVLIYIGRFRGFLPDFFEVFSILSATDSD